MAATAATHRFQDEWLASLIERKKPLVAKALPEIRAAKCPSLSEELIKRSFLTPGELGAMLESHYGIAMSEPKAEDLEAMAVSLIPEKLCRKHNLIAVRLAGDSLVVAMSDPCNPDVISDIGAVAGRTIKPQFCLPARIAQLIEEKFNPMKAADEFAKQLSSEITADVVVEEEKGEEELNPLDVVEGQAEGPVANIATSIFVNAIKMRASDIHIEQEETRTVVRYRIDGQLRNVLTLPKHLGCGPLVTRIKVMGKMDVADRRRPLDGRAKIKLDGHDIGLRISTLPTALGEKVVVRILDKRSAEIPFESLGFRKEVRDRLQGVLDAEVGLLLVTGPTGSGKTTTLYACVNYLRSEASNIVTIEDPVEYKLDGINQVQINDKAGLTFAAVLRSVLRQDPDVVLLGEMRDKETAEIAFQASNTGHFVLSTLHSNNCVATVTRLVQMGIDPYKIASPMSAVTSQRLIRRVCAQCRQDVPASELPRDMAAAAERMGLTPKLVRGAGCVQCAQTGFRGRVVVTELLSVNQEVKSMITAGIAETEFRKRALTEGWLMTPEDDLIWHVCVGDTSIEEARREGGEEKAAEASPAAAAVAVPAPPASAKEVMIVDDEESIRILLKRILKAEGYRVREAPNGGEAVKMLHEKIPDLLITDLQMPVLDGVGVIKAVRGDLKIWNVPIVILTAVNHASSQTLAQKIGVDDYIVKPFDEEALLARVAALLRRAELRQP
ncbi:MAG: type II/IV secretion system protein [Elusimicrobia bacterium]|nr:type II/IV secretion system protein [Elusimicrobiota bacterium]